MPLSSPSHPAQHQSPTGDHKAKEQGRHTGACKGNTVPATLPHTPPPAHPAPGLGEPSQPAQPDPNEPGCAHATGSSLQPRDQRMLPTLPGAGAGAAQDRSVPSTAPGQGGRAQPRSRGAAPRPPHPPAPGSRLAQPFDVAAWQTAAGDASLSDDALPPPVPALSQPGEPRQAWGSRSRLRGMRRHPVSVALRCG